jgi:hypothetical protein
VEKRLLIFYVLIGFSIMTVLSALIPGIAFPFLFLFFPLMFRSRSFSERSPQYIRPEYCALCGYKLRHNWKFCPSCSQPIEIIEEEEQNFSQFK